MIESPKNDLLKDIRRLRRCKEDRAVLEGPHLLLEAVAAGVTIESVLVTPEFEQANPKLVAGLPTRPQHVTAGALRTVTDSETPRGVLAVVTLPRRGVESLPVDNQGVYLFVDGVQDPGNLGALARVAEAAGVAGVAMSPGTAHPNHPRALRASAGSLLRIPVAMGVEADSVAHHLEALDAPWIALSADGEQDLFENRPDVPVVVAVGAERGLSAAVEARCDLRLRIPTEPPVESLNTAVAAALALYEIKRQ